MHGKVHQNEMDYMSTKYLPIHECTYPMSLLFLFLRCKISMDMLTSSQLFKSYTHIISDKQVIQNTACILRGRHLQLNWFYSQTCLFVDPLCYSCFVSVMLSYLFIAALWSSAGKGLTSWLSCIWCFLVFLSLFHGCPGSGEVLDCIDSLL